MVSRVNTRFVTILCLSLTGVLVVVAIIAASAILKDGSELVEIGDEAMKNKEYDKAVEVYSKAVRKSTTNVEWINKWIEALRSSNPQSRAVYTDRYFQQYLNLAMRSRARLDPSNATYSTEFIEEFFNRFANYGSSLAGWESLHKDASELAAACTDSPDRAAVLKRYAGLCGLQVMLLNATASNDLIETVRKDLTAAFDAHPNDAECAVAIAAWHRAAAKRADAAGKPEVSAEEMGAGRKVLDDFDAAHPGAPEVMLAKLDWELEAEGNNPNRTKTLQEWCEERTPQFMALADAILALEPAKVSPRVVSRSSSMFVLLGPEGVAKAEATLDHLAKSGRAVALVLLEKGQMHMTLGHAEEADAAFQQVIDLPTPPLCMDGTLLFELRGEAIKRKFDNTLGRWEKAATPEEKATFLQSARAMREEYVQREGNDARLRPLVDAKLRFAEGDVDTARRLLSQYKDGAGKDDVDALALLGEILRRQGNIGAARTQFEAALALRPGAIPLMLTLGQIETALGNRDKAMFHFDNVLKTDPGNQAAQEFVRRLTETAVASTSTDPFINTVARVREAITQPIPDYAAAEKLLKDQLAKPETKDNVDLINMLAQVLISAGRRADAKAVVDDAMMRVPENKQLKSIQVSLEHEDPIEAQLALIGQSEEPELTKTLWRFDVYRRAGRTDEAKAALDAAAAIDAKDPKVLEAQFLDAQGRGDAAEMRRIADVQAAADPASPRHLMMRARALLLEGKHKEAADMAASVTQADPLNYYAWYLLGLCQARQNQFAQAEDSYRRALDIRPADANSIKDLMKVYAQQQKLGDAIELARRSSTLVISDDEFVELWMQAETIAPSGDKSKVLQVRRNLAGREPSNLANRSALAMLLMEQKQWAEAKTHIDAIKAANTSLDSADLEARWYLAQADYSGAFNTYETLIASIPEDKRTAEPYIRKARAMLVARQVEAALDSLIEGRKYQSDKLEADREHAVTLFQLNRFQEAAGVYRTVYSAAKEDPDNQLAKGYVESLFRSGDNDGALQALDSMGVKAEQDPQLGMLRATVLALKGDYTGARRLYDQGVARSPNDPVAFIIRAQFNMQFPEFVREAEADFDRALKLDPGNQIGRSALVDLYLRSGRWDDATNELRKAIRINPDDDYARDRLVVLLLSRQKETDALVILDEIIARRPSDLLWRNSAGVVNGRLERWKDAARHFEAIWASRPSYESALPLLDALLQQGMDGTTRAAEILATKELNTDNSVSLLVCRSWMKALQGKGAEAKADLIRAASGANPDDQRAASVFFETLKKPYEKAADRLAAVISARPPEGYKGWMAFGVANLKLSAEATRNDGLLEMDALMKSAGEKNLKVECARAAGGAAYAVKDYQKAADYFAAALDLAPDDSEINNNLAYTLAYELKRPQEALPLAQKAAAADSKNSSILDTLGTIYMLLGDNTKAEETLMLAVRMATTPDDAVGALLHLADLALKAGKKDEALKYLGSVEEIFKEDPTLEAARKDEIKRIRTAAQS